MSGPINLIARMRARAGQEAALKQALGSLVAPTRREAGCIQYDFLQDPAEAREFCFVERWESETALARHTDSDHLKKVLAEARDYIDSSEGRQYVQV